MNIENWGEGEVSRGDAEDAEIMGWGEFFTEGNEGWLFI